MGCRWYLAMTGAEYAVFSGEGSAAWMSCRFSTVHPGLVNLPKDSPALLILDDLIPFDHHDPQRIARELNAVSPEGILLDFQREWDARPVIEAILNTAPCPVAVTQQHSDGWDCPVLISPPLNIPIAQAVPKNRECWLDVAVGMQTFTITEAGCAMSGILEPSGEFPFTDHGCHCRYRREDRQKEIRFCLYRPPEMLGDILKAAEDAGIQKAIGLYRDFVR
ncbi:MAG: hypothetical protein IKW10_06805 [Oscillospiraceae bacterium]|nr:hypothetical protein [Oscillospiraceae bacterium]